MSNPEAVENLNLPCRIFAIGEEPNGQRVNSYLKPNRIFSILNALRPDEAREIRNSSFGKIIATAEKPPFSGAFGQFIITRMLYVKKKHEIWFLFAGWPIRVSLREFAIVTGLPCGKFPKTNKKKKRLLVEDKKYWGELFGKLESLTVDSVVKLLKKRIVRDRPRRIKYAYLALTAAVLYPTSHFPKILDEHVELIRDLDQFLAYPWGRLSFEMVVTSIKSRDELALAQKSLAVQGFFHAFQLVMVEAVPAILEVVEVGQSSSSSESDSEIEEEARDSIADSLGEVNSHIVPDQNKENEANASRDEVLACTSTASMPRVHLSPGHARDIDTKCDAFVKCIIPADDGMDLDESLLSWSDDEEDEKVNNMVRLIAEGFHFQKHMFEGGVTLSEIEVKRKEREEAKKEKDEAKDKKGKGKVKVSKKQAVSANIDCSQITDIVVQKLKPLIKEASTKAAACCTQINKLEGAVSGCLDQIKHVAGTVSDVDRRCQLAISDSIQSIQDDVVAAVLKTLAESPNMPAYGNVSVGRENMNSPFMGVSEPSKQKSTPGVLGNTNKSDGAVIGNVLEEVRRANAECALDGQTVSLAQVFPEMGENMGMGLVNSTVISPQVNQGGGATGLLGRQSNSVGVGVDCEQPQRKSKQLRTQPIGLEGFECTRAVNSRVAALPVVQGVFPEIDYEEKYARLAQRLKTNRMVNVSNGTQVSSKDVLEIAERTKVLAPKVVDALVHFSRILFMRALPGPQSNKIRFFDTKFVSSFIKHYPKFSRVAAKDRAKFVFQEPVLEMVRNAFLVIPSPDRFYFPFFVDKSHWVGVCVDTRARSIQVLDCNMSLRSDNLFKKDLTPIAVMLPFLLKAATMDPNFSVQGAFSLDRARGVPQNPTPADSAVTTMLLIRAHSMVGFEGCKCIIPEALPTESRRLAVGFYLEFGGSICGTL